MKEKPFITIIVPVYNVEQYLNRCIDSIIDQFFTDWELILVDDGSSDGSPSICDQYELMDDRIHVVHKKNGGQSTARNLGLDIMLGAYCTFVDSDDYIHPRYLDYLLSIADKHDADLIQCTFERGNKNDFSHDPFENKYPTCNFTNRTIFESVKNNVILCGKIYKSTLWANVRMPEGRIYEDHAVAWKLYYYANKITVIDIPLYYYRNNPNSTMAISEKAPIIELPMQDYHERISYFESIGDRHLTDLSKWRYSKYLMTSMGNRDLNKDQRTLLCKEFRNIFKDVLLCKTVPLSNKLLIILSLISPVLVNIVISIVRK